MCLHCANGKPSIAIEDFDSINRFNLQHCHKHLILRDEVYCQLMKQTTANRSSFPDSSQRAWRLLSILAAYFGCSDSLKPYLIEHLTSATTDRKGTAAAVCLTNLRKTARCGGRKNVKICHFSG